MGKEARCLASFGDWTGDGKLLLETDDLIFRGAERLQVALADVKAAKAEDGWLIVQHTRGRARFDLGDAAIKWAHAILNPKTRADKLGVKPASKALVLGLDEDDGFMNELRERTDNVDVGGRKRGYDLIFLRVEAVRDLDRIASLVPRIQPAGGIWVIHPKGRKDLAHEVLVGAARAAGLVDNKTARFSDTHTGLRFVIPKDRR